MRKFLKNIIIFIIPFVFLVLYYVAIDPFVVFWRYKYYDESKSKAMCGNEALLGIQLLDIYADSLHYNSFILGNSRSMYYPVAEWKRYLEKDAVGFHFHQLSDNLQGTTERIHYLYKRFNDDSIKNILIIMDIEFLEDMSHHKGYIHRNPWQVTEECDFVDFHLNLIGDYFSIEYIMSKFNHKKGLRTHRELTTNEYYCEGAEELLNAGKVKEYYSNFGNHSPFYPRDTIEIISEPVIKEEQIEALKSISCLMKSNNTDYRVVISPLYDQEKLNPKDLATLEVIFGKNKVFDFSGINEYTNDTINYYEASHYRPKLCKKILRAIY